MYTIPSDVAAVMRGSYASQYVADAFYDGVPTLTGMRLAKKGSIDGSASSRVQTTASITVESSSMYMAGSGESIAPESGADALATYGQEIVISRQVWFGRQLVGSVPCGTFRISEAPTITQYGKRFGNGNLITAAGVELKLDDRFEPIDAAEFASVQSPGRNATMWGEVRRFSPYPITIPPTITDRSVARTMVYQDSRLDTISDLLALAQAEPGMTRTGNLTARLIDPLAAGIAPVDLTGTIQPFTRAMSNEFKNHIVVTTVVDGATQTIAEAKITDGLLRWDGPAGDRVERVDSGLADTKMSAQNLAVARLNASMSGRASQVKLTCLPNLSVELGDPVTATDPLTGATVTGVVKATSLSLDPTELMDITISTKVYA